MFPHDLTQAQREAWESFIATTARASVESLAKDVEHLEERTRQLLVRTLFLSPPDNGVSADDFAEMLQRHRDALIKMLDSLRNRPADGPAT